MIIIRNLIDKYINYLTVDNVISYANKKNIFITNDEANIIYDFIKNNYGDLLENEDSLLKLKPFIREELFEKVVLEYIENKTKYL